MHKAFFNGEEAGVLTLAKDADDDFNIALVDEDNIPVNLTTGTLTVEVYDTADRRNAAIKSWAITTPDAPTGGAANVPVSVATTGFGPGIFYAYTKYVLSGATTLCRNPTKIKMT